MNDGGKHLLFCLPVLKSWAFFRCPASYKEVNYSMSISRNNNMNLRRLFSFFHQTTTRNVSRFSMAKSENVDNNNHHLEENTLAYSSEVFCCTLNVESTRLFCPPDDTIIIGI